MKNPFLIGPAVYLRPLERGDAAQLATWFNDPDILRLIRRYRPVTLAEEEEFLDRVWRSENDLTLGIALRADDRLIGSIGLHLIDWRNRHASFGIVLGDKSEWGKGHGAEATRLIVGHAFETLNLNRVWLHVYEYNQRAVRSYEKVGFRHEGRLRQEIYREGRYWDTLVMALLRDEWKS